MADKTTIRLWILNAIIHLGYPFIAVHVDPLLKRDPLYGDADNFDTIAWSLAQGHFFNIEIHRAPLFPLMMSIIYRIFGHAPLLIRVLNGGLILLCAAFMMPFVKTKFGDRVAKVFLLLFSLYPLTIYIAGWIYSEPLMLCLMGAITSAYFFIRQKGYPLIGALLLGLLMGLITLTRSTGLVFGTIFSLWLFYDAKGRKGAVTALVSLFVMCAVVAPWTYRNWTVWHKFIPVASGGRLLWLSNNDKSDGREVIESTVQNDIIFHGKHETEDQAMIGTIDDIDRDKVEQQIGMEWIKAHPERFVALWPYKLYYALTPVSVSPQSELTHPIPKKIRLPSDIIYAMFLGVVFYGIYNSWKFSWRDTAPMWIMSLTLLAILLVFNGSPRYLLPVAPMLCLYFAYAWVQIRPIKTYNSENLPGEALVREDDRSRIKHT